MLRRQLQSSKESYALGHYQLEGCSCVVQIYALFFSTKSSCAAKRALLPPFLHTDFFFSQPCPSQTGFISLLHLTNLPLKAPFVRSSPSNFSEISQTFITPKRSEHYRVQKKSPTFLEKSPTFFGKSPTFLEKSPTFFEKAPTFFGKSPTFFEKVPTFFEKVPTFFEKAPT